jgi:hypothetical protein
LRDCSPAARELTLASGECRRSIIAAVHRVGARHDPAPPGREADEWGH